MCNNCFGYSHDSDDVASNNRIKAAFQLMGIEMNENKRPLLVGNVEYKMKHIRLQNRHLKFHKFKTEKPKHIHFDDEGNPIPIDEEVNVLTLQNAKIIIICFSD